MPHLNDPSALLRRLFETAVARADPMRVVAQYLPPAVSGRLLVIGAGKASARMAEAVEASLGPCDGLVVTRYGHARPTRGIEIVEAAHPVPDAAGAEATIRLLRRVAGLDRTDLVLALISGGGSSLLCAPQDGLDLADKRALNEALLASGAPIAVMNAIRTRASRVKGGRLALACAPARVLTLVISDVPGDDPAEVASGPTVGARTAPDVGALIDRHDIDVPAHVRAALQAAPPPILAGDPRLAHTTTAVIAAPWHSLEAAAAVLDGWDVRQLGDALEGEARDLARAQASEAIKIADRMTSGSRPVALLSGGEVTVTRRGDGVGGPNAEFALAAALALNGHPRIHLLAGDTDGVDGAAEVAGAIVRPDTLARAGVAEARGALARNDSHGFFARLGDQVVTGPTLTNVNDFRAILILPPA